MSQLNLILRSVLCFLLVTLPLTGVDQWFYDRVFRVRGPRQHPTQFAVVRIHDNLGPASQSTAPGDVANLLPLESRLIWREQYYRNLLQRLREGGARLIVFTSFYDGVEAGIHPPLDQSNLIFAAALNEENKLIPPLTSLTRRGNYGFANLFPDPDNVVRRTHLVYSSGASLALRTYHRLNVSPIKRDLLQPMWIDFRGPSRSYPTYGAEQILQGNIDLHRAFDGKIVMVGREGTVFADFETPFGRMSRPEVQANIMETFLEGREIRMLPRKALLALSVFSVIGAIAVILALPLSLAWLALLGYCMLLLGGCFTLFSHFKIWAGISNTIFSVFGTYLLLLGYKLSRQEEKQWRIQQEAENFKQIDQFKNNFISLFSHDLRTPIAKIKAVLERLQAQHPNLAPDIRDGFRSIDRTNSELARLIEDILKVTKMESMSMEPAHEVIDINRLVEECLTRLKFFADERGVRFTLDLEPLFSIEGDPHLLQEVVFNLAENAIKYSGQGTDIVIRTTEEENRVRVSVRDTGPGIPAEEIPRVTGKFYRGKTASDTTKGSGLGLYLAKYFVEMHGGELEIASELGKGTEVSFSLPVQ